MSAFQTPMLPWPSLQSYARTLQIAGRTLFFYDTGQEDDLPPILLVHGLGDEADTWRRILPDLASSRRVIALDLPGFGRSELPEQPVSIDTYVEILHALLDALQISEVTLVGHSMGGIIVQTFGLKYPTRCAELVLIAGGLIAGKTPLNMMLVLFLIPGIGELAYNSLRRDPQAAYRTLEPYYYSLDQLPKAERDFLYSRVNQRVWSDKQRRAFLGALRSLAGWLPSRQKQLSAQLGATHLPSTTILWGAQDRIVPVENAHALAALLPQGNIRVIIVEECGHNLQQDAPERLLQVLQS